MGYYGFHPQPGKICNLLTGEVYLKTEFLIDLVHMLFKVIKYSQDAVLRFLARDL